MKIGITADTHIPGKAKAIPEIVLDAFKNVDHIIHGGDIGGREVLDKLGELAPVTAVAGNTDDPELCRRLGERRILELGGIRFGLFHGHGNRGTTLKRTLERFADERLDCIIFGHSHIPFCQVRNGVLLFNPGSPTDKRRNPFYSFGIIETEPELSAQIIYFDKEGILKERVVF
jgi:phosphoesterase, MJ0936 family